MSIIDEFSSIIDDLQDHKSSIRYFYVSRYEVKFFALFVTERDEVYALGFNKNGKLAANNLDIISPPAKISTLCGKGIDEFIEGESCMAAKNSAKQIYIWGKKFDHQGQPKSENNSFYKEPERIEYFDKKSIISICFGSNHGLALSRNGLIYGWGDNSDGQVFGCGTIPSNEEPEQINLSNEENIKFKLIQCYKNISAVISLDGRVFIWGNNCLGFQQNFGNFFMPPWTSIQSLALGQFEENFVLYLLSNKDDVIYCLSSSSNNKEIKISDSKPTNIHFIRFYNKFICETESTIIDLNQKKKTIFNNLFEYYLHSFGTTYKTFGLNSGKIYTKNSIIKIIGNEQIISLTASEISINYLSKKDKHKDNFVMQINLGKGGFGTVCKYKDKTNGKEYAIKELDLSGFYKSSIDISYIRREIRILSKLSNEFVIKFIEAWIDSPEKICIQMEPGICDLNKFLESKFCIFGRRSPLEEGENLNVVEYFICCELFKELTECIDYLHSLTPIVIHRDLKADNILVTDGRTGMGTEWTGRFLRVCDFGLSTYHYTGKYHTKSPGGTPGYIDSRMNAEETYDETVDIFALGRIAAIIFELRAEGREGFNLASYKSSVMEENLDDLKKLVMSCSANSKPSCRDILKRMRAINIDPIILGKYLITPHFEREQDHIRRTIFQKFFDNKLGQLIQKMAIKTAKDSNELEFEAENYFTEKDIEDILNRNDNKPPSTFSNENRNDIYPKSQKLLEKIDEKVINREPNNVVIYLDASNIYPLTQQYSGQHKNYQDSIPDTTCRIDIKELVNQAINYRNMIKGELFGCDLSEFNRFYKKKLTQLNIHYLNIGHFKSNDDLKSSIINDLRGFKSKFEDNLSVIFFTGAIQFDLVQIIDYAIKLSFKTEIWSYIKNLTPGIVDRVDTKRNNIQLFIIEEYISWFTFNEIDYKGVPPKDLSIVVRMLSNFSKDNFKKEIIKYASKIFRLPFLAQFDNRNLKDLILIPAVDENQSQSLNICRHISQNFDNFKEFFPNSKDCDIFRYSDFPDVRGNLNKGNHLSISQKSLADSVTYDSDLSGLQANRIKQLSKPNPSRLISDVKCKFGVNCRYLKNGEKCWRKHTDEEYNHFESSPTRQDVSNNRSEANACKYFKQGTCRNGQNCRFDH